jgi:squalene synthase HpnC
VPLADAYAACARLAAAHYENFPVASRLVPSRMRPHIAAVYAFARTADDFADEEGYTLAERHALLEDWHRRLLRAAGSEIAGTEVPAPHQPASPQRQPTHARHEPASPRRQPWATVEPGLQPAASEFPDVRERPANVEPRPQSRRTAVDPDLIFLALAHTMKSCSLEVGLFEDLLSAFRQDTVVKRYATWDDVLDYCRRSANPVGRLVLRIAGYRDVALDRSSDALCTALQLTNFWQDLAIDWRRGRLYIPLAERDAAGARDADLDAARMTPAWQAALGQATARTRELFERGRPVCDGVHGRLMYELRLTWLGATRILDQLEASRFDVFNRRPSLRAADAPRLVGELITWRRRVA